MLVSVFDNIDLKGAQCTSATKNVSDYGQTKFITVRVRYLRGKDELVVSSVCTRDKDYHPVTSTNIKVLYSLTTSTQEVKRDHRFYGTGDVSDCVIKDLEFVERMFLSAPDDVKRVY